LGRLKRPFDTGRGAMRSAVLWAACIALFALIPRAITTGRFQTADEVAWMRRSFSFGNALLRLDPASASATTGPLATMPGVTTMWLGTAAGATRALATRLGLTADDGVVFTESRLALHLSQLAVAVTTSMLIGLIVLLAWRWASPVTAVSAGALLASEPFLVGHGSILHTDELTALFGAAAILALFLALGIPEPAVVTRRRAVGMLGGALLGGALLSKLSALALLPGLALVVAGALLQDAARSRGSGAGAAALRLRGTLLVISCWTVVATVVLVWPASWADPSRQLGLLLQSAGLARTAHKTFFLGRITGTPGPLYYLVAIPLRMTPWFLLASLVLIPMAFVGRWRRHALILLIIAAPFFAVLSFADRSMDRYALPAWPLAALAVGLGVDALIERGDARVGKRPARLVAAGFAVAVLMMLHAVAVTPWSLAYFNPLLGGSKAGEQAVLVGWGEGLELAGELIREREAPACDVRVALNYAGLISAFPCGTTTRDPSGADYAVLYVNHRQRLAPDELERWRHLGQPVGLVSIRGIDYAEVYDLRKPAAGALNPVAATGEQTR
jgi:hypothetical protein